MKHRFYINLNDYEHKTLCEVREKTGSKSFREAILTICNSKFVERLSYVLLIEKELRKISVNFHQIIRKLEQSNTNCDRFYSVGNFLSSIIETFTKEVNCIHPVDTRSTDERKEVAIRMTLEEKEILSKVKKVLHFMTYRTMVLSLCFLASNQINEPDFSAEYSKLKNIGLLMNETAKALNSGYGLDYKNFTQFIKEFVQVLINLSMKIDGGKENAA